MIIHDVYKFFSGCKSWLTIAFIHECVNKCSHSVMLQRISRNFDHKELAHSIGISLCAILHSKSIDTEKKKLYLIY